MGNEDNKDKGKDKGKAEDPVIRAARINATAVTRVAVITTAALVADHVAKGLGFDLDQHTHLDQEQDEQQH